MSISEFEIEQAKWRDLVGGFILAFGDIEVITHRLWRDYCNGKAPLFKPRVEALLGALNKLEPKNDAVISCLEAAYRMADKRNTIAHNPTQAQVFQHGRTGELLIEMAISSATIDDYIDDADLKELRAEAEDLVTRLYMALGFIEKKANNG
ncbi:MAG: hypothetical protein WBC07_01025 [Methylotenera sp.]